MDDTQNITSSLNVEKTVLAIPVLMFVVGVVGNVTAIAVLSKTKKESKESAFYTLVCGLAVTDLLGTCLASPITIATYLEHSWPGTLCEFHSFLLLFFGAAGLSIICTMSAERYLAISHPYTYRRWAVDQHTARWSLFSIYVGNVLLCCLPLLGFSKSIHQPPNTWCFIDWRSRISRHVFYSFLYAGISSLLILLTIACNVALCWTLLVMRRRTKRFAPRASMKRYWRERSSGVEIQMMLLLLVTSLVVLVCSTPLVVRIFVNQRWLVDDWGADLQAIRFASVNPILDPWVYILMRRTVFHKLLRISRRILRGRTNSVERAHPTVQYLLEKNCAIPIVLSSEALDRVYFDDKYSNATVPHEDENEPSQ